MPPNSAPSLLSPKELAGAVGASESSIRRWVDSGQLRMSRTAGGHRRIPLAEAVRFVRDMGLTVVRPELLGLEDLGKLSAAAPNLSDDDRLYEALLAGERRMARGLILSWFLDGRGAAALFDGPVRAALQRIGQLWKHESRGILIEHRATEICIGAIWALRELLPPPASDAPLALGGAPQDDPYLLPSLMASSVLAAAGFRDVNFGANTPVSLLSAEAIERNARLVWLSISSHQDSKATRSEVRKLAAALARRDVPLILGGRMHADYAPRGLANVHIASSMAELAAFAEIIRGGGAK